MTSQQGLWDGVTLRQFGAYGITLTEAAKRDEQYRQALSQLEASPMTSFRITYRVQRTTMACWIAAESAGHACLTLLENERRSHNHPVAVRQITTRCGAPIRRRKRVNGTRTYVGQPYRFCTHLTTQDRCAAHRGS